MSGYRDLLPALERALVEAMGSQIPRGHVWNVTEAAGRLMPVVDRIATERAAAELKATADDLDDIAANVDPRRRSPGVARGYRLAAHVNRSIAAVLEEHTDAAVGR